MGLRSRPKISALWLIPTSRINRVSLLFFTTNERGSPASPCHAFSRALSWSISEALRALLLNERFIFSLIGLNAILLFALGFPGLSAELRLALSWIDDAITICFITEAALKIRRDSIGGYLGDGWNRFDFIIVLLSLPSLLDTFLGDDLNQYSVFLLLRMARVMKLIRVLRFLPDIDRTLEGVARAVRASILIVITFFLGLFIAAILSQRLFAGADPANFGDPILALYSTFKVFTVEGWFEIPDRLVAELPPLAAFFARFYFIGLLMIGGIFGLSLVNSIFVDAMVADNNDELEAKIDALTEEIRALKSALEGSDSSELEDEEGEEGERLSALGGSSGER